MPRLHVQLLGDFRLAYGDTAITRLSSARLPALLAYLLLHRGAPRPRQHLAFLFWPDSSEAQAQTNLRKLLYLLRQDLPEADRFLLSEGPYVQWRSDAPLSLDVANFETAMARADQAAQAGDQAGQRQALEEAVAVYHGDLLPSCYDDWVLPERERLRQVFVGALEQLALLLESELDYVQAIQHAQRLLQQDPLHEATYRHLMHLHALNDDRAAALRVYHTCVTTLQRELAVEPSPTTRQMYERLLSLTAPPEPLRAQAIVLPLVGRESEWIFLQNVWRDAATRRPHLVLIKGEAGIGKTRLAEELVEWVSRQGFTALTAHCYSAETQLAYAPVVEWLRAHPVHGLDDVWLTELARLLPEVLAERPDLPQPAPLTEDWQRLRLFKALAYALLKGHSPLLLYIDDLQWCDRDTLDWLRYLLQSHLEAGARAQLLVVGTLRVEEIERRHPVESLLNNVRHTGQVTEVELGPLTEQATLALAQHVSGKSLDPALAPLLYQGTEGHPLFVVEMVRAGAAQIGQRTASHAREMIQATQTLPAKVQQVIQARLAQLSTTTQDLVGLAATVGRAFTFDVVRHASSSDEETLVRGLDELWQRRIIREKGADAYDFSHEKIREVAYAGLSSARRRLLHREVAEALEAVHAADPDAVSGQIALHCEHAGQPVQAIAYYRRAASVAQVVYANEEAIGHYQYLLNSELRQSLAPEDTCAVMLSLGQVYRLTGRWAQAEDMNRQGLARAEALGSVALQAQARRALADVMRLQGKYDEALSWLALAQEGFQASGDMHGVVLALWTMGEIYWYKGDHPQAFAALNRQLEIATEIGDQRGMCDALGTIGMVYGSQGDWEQAIECCLKSIAIAQTLGDKLVVARAAITIGNVWKTQDNADQALHWYGKASSLAREIGDWQVLLWATVNVAGILADRREHLRALVGYERTLRNALDMGDRWTACLDVGFIGHTLENLERYTDAEAMYRKAIQFGRRLGIPSHLSGMLTNLAHLLLEQGRAAEAMPYHQEAVAMMSAVGGKHLAGEDMRFYAKLLGIRLRRAVGWITPAEAKEEFEHVLRQSDTPTQQAALYYELWRLDSSQDAYRVQAADLYRTLYAATFVHECRQRYLQLTRELLPEPPPLPNVSELIPLETVCIDEMLARLEPMVAALEALFA